MALVRGTTATVHGRAFRRGIGAMAMLAGLALLLSGCGSGPLIPPRPIPGAGVAGVPLTTHETARSWQPAAPPAAPASNAVASAPLLAPSTASPPAASSTAQPRTGPQRAHRFPADEAPATNPGLTQHQTARGEPPRHEVPRHETTQHKAASAIRFTPVIGAPVSAIEPLSTELEEAARRHGIVIRTTADKPVDAILRGYFSASKHGSRITITYVWDVLDARGNRLYRINGKESAPAGAGDLWASVPDSTMRKIASKTIDAYLSWHAGRS